MANSDNVHEKLFALLDSLYADHITTDGQGIILHASPVFEKRTGISKKDIVGTSVFLLEQQEVFVPSVTIQALKKRKQVTMIQHVVNYDREILSTAIPIFDENNEIQYVISHTWDDEDLQQIREHYGRYKELLARYSSEIRELRARDMAALGIIAESPQMNNVLKLALKVAGVETNVLLTGESGVGKNVIARLIHQKSKRSKGPFIEINCGAIPENLLESELFGYEKGSFTGALREGKVGMIEMAQDGTLFLDEIGELSLALQVKLLKVIQEKMLTKVGAVRPLKVDFRLIAATNQDLNQLVEEGRFREDLYYRLSVVPVYIPPLKERQEDILPLIRYFLEQANHKYHTRKQLSKVVISRLLSYPWPGNVRELQNLIERLVVTSDGNIINEENLPGYFRTYSVQARDKNVTLKKALEMLEREMVLKAYESCKTTVGVSKELGISQPSAVRKLKKYVAGYAGTETEAAAEKNDQA